MKTAAFQHFLLRSAVAMMACDGSIDEEEITEIKNMADNEIYFMGYEVDQPLAENIAYIKEKGTAAINEYLNDLVEIKLKSRQELLLIEVLIRTIEADNVVDDSEVKFLQLVKSKLQTSEETIITQFPKQMSYLIDFNNYGSSGTNFTDELDFGNDTPQINTVG